MRETIRAAIATRQFLKTMHSGRLNVDTDGRDEGGWQRESERKGGEDNTRGKEVDLDDQSMASRTPQNCEI